MTKEEEETIRHYLGLDENNRVIWLVSPQNRIKVGDLAGGIDSEGYIEILLKGRVYRGHRILWFLFHGRWPSPGLVLDHINGVKDDNRLCNLREVPQWVNMHNTKIRREGRPLGVVLHRKSGRWHAVRPRFHNGHRYGEKYLGTFDTMEEAAKTVMDALGVKA